MVPELKREKKEWPAYFDFEKQARSRYNEESDINIWYAKTRKENPDLNWPASPDLTYKNSEWKGWSELVGKK